ncbi:MAG: branched-chain amino acid ABC transporter permease [Bdellovibrionota bacterium]
MKWFKNPILSLIAMLIVGLIFNFSVNAYIQITILFIMVNCILALSLNLVNGLTGQFSLGHAGFMAVGAYFAAYAGLNWSFGSPSLLAFQFFLYTLGGGILAAICGYLVGLPSLRLKGDYLAIVTLGFGEIIRVTLLNIDTLGGARGISGIPSFPEYDPVIFTSFFTSYIFASIWLIICFFFLWRIMQSQNGRAFLSVREDEIAAEALGVNTTKAKVRSFVISSFFAGVAGALYAHLTNYISPSSFTFLQSVNVVIMVVLGGMGSFSGAILAAAFVTIAPELLRSLQAVTGVDLRMVIFSLCLILIMIFRPKGLMGEKELTDVFPWLRLGRKKA